MSPLTNYNESDLEFLDDWAEKWQSLCHVFFDVLYDEPLATPKVKLDFQFANRRQWLLDHEQRFLSLWVPYYQSLDWSLRVDKDLLEHIENAERVLSNPFGIFYGFVNLDEFLKYATELNRRKPSHKRAIKVAGALLAINKLAADFVQSAYETVYSSQ